MKKLFMLLLSSALITSAFAQPGYDRYERNRVRDRDRHNGRWGRSVNQDMTKRECDNQVDRIIWDYDLQITAIKRDNVMRRQEKRWRINMLERQRDEQVARVYEVYRRSNGGDYANNRRRA